MKYSIVLFPVLLLLLFPQMSSAQNCSAGFNLNGSACYDVYNLGVTTSFITTSPYNPQLTYQWTPSGGTIVSGQGTGSINVHWSNPGMAGLSLSVFDAFGCFDSYSTQVYVEGGYGPGVTGPDTVCMGDTIQFTNNWFMGPGGPSSYAGNYNHNATVVNYVQSPSTGVWEDDTLELVWDELDTNAYVHFEHVLLSSFCTTLGLKDLVLLGAMRGPENVCTGDTVQYEMLHGVTVNNWTVIGGGIVSGQGSNLLTVVWPTTGPGSVSCNWQCPNSGNKTTNRNVNASIPAPPLITGPNPMCSSVNGTFHYSVPQLANHTYTWNLTNLSVVQGGTPSSMVTVVPDTHSVVYFEVTDHLGSCSATTIDTIVNSHPVFEIVGDEDFCWGDSQAFALSTPFAGATFTWGLSGGTFSGQGTDSVKVNWPGAGRYLVQATVTLNGCSNTVTDTIDVYAGPVVDMGPDIVYCPGVYTPIQVWDQNDPFPSCGPEFLNSFGQTCNFMTIDTTGVYWIESSETFGSLTCMDRDTLEAIHNPNAAQVNLGANLAICPDTSVVLDAGASPLSYLWSTGATSQTLVATVGGTYWVEVSNSSGCDDRDTVEVMVLSDCVFPGDANHDGIADNTDLLNIGIAFNSTGGMRPGATTMWYGQPEANWASSFASGTNYKHADSDGNSIINDDDTLAILTNYGLTHTKTSGGGRVGVPLRLVPQQAAVYWGDTIHVDIHLGDVGDPADLVYGLAFTTLVNPNSIVTGGSSIEYMPSFLGAKGSDLITLWQPNATPYQQDHALVRTNQVDVSGFGPIATLHYVVDSTAFLGQDTGYFSISLADPLLVDRFETEKLMATMDTTVMVLQSVVGLDLSSELGLQIRPNPAHESSEVSLLTSLGTPVTLHVIDLRGKVLLEKKMTGNGMRQVWQVDTETLSKGVYLIKVAAGEKLQVEKLMIQH